MASILKVDTIQDQDGNNIISEAANTITIGASGDTITIPSGATLANSGIVTGFQSTGIDDNATSTAITIDSSERVGIGTASILKPLHLRKDNAGNSETLLLLQNNSGTDGTEVEIRLAPTNYARDIGNVQDGGVARWSSIRATRDGAGNGTRMSFLTNSGGATPSERIRIDSSGNVGIGTTSISPAKIKVVASVGPDAAYVFLQNSTSTNSYDMSIYKNNTTQDNNSARFLTCQDNTAGRLIIYGDGDVKNHDNSYGSLSDERIKQDIRDSNSQWNDIKNVRVRKFKKKDDVRQYGENAWEQIGVVAQELETVSPKLIKHSDPTSSDILSDSSFGTLYQEGDEIPEGKEIGDVKEVHQQVKGVSYSVLYMKSIKALQEAMERIETLEAKVQTLETNQS